MITAKFSSACSKCGCTIKKGTNIYYWPSDRKVYCEKCGEVPYRQFQSEAADEDMMNGNGPCAYWKEKRSASFLVAKLNTSRTFSPLKSIRQLVFNWDGHLPVSLLLHFWFLFQESHCWCGCTLACCEFGSRSSHALTQPQMELYFGFRTRYKSNLYWRF
jgi:hypothetical protein